MQFAVLLLLPDPMDLLLPQPLRASEDHAQPSVRGLHREVCYPVPGEVSRRNRRGFYRKIDEIRGIKAPGGLIEKPQVPSGNKNELLLPANGEKSEDPPLYLPEACQ